MLELQDAISIIIELLGTKMGECNEIFQTLS